MFSLSKVLPYFSHSINLSPYDQDMPGGGFRLGQIFGIEIRVDWSWIFIFFLVTWSLVVGVFPRLHPDWGFGLNLVVGLSASILFFSSVLAHELAHSLVARAKGLPVSQITLFLFGGVSNLEREPSSPGDEFIIAVVGPLTSIILGAAFLFLGGVAAGEFAFFGTDAERTLSQFGPVSTLLAWLGPINILLGIFNLIPGFPLDGGRVLRSVLWKITNDFREATRYASYAGRGVAWLFIFTGVSMILGVRVPVLGTGLIAGLWIAFIGWFLNGIATQSYRQVVIEGALKNVPVSRLMRSKFTTVPPGVSVHKLLHDYILGTNERAFPVSDNQKLVGLVTLDDVRKVSSEKWHETKAEEVMTPVGQTETVGPNESAAEALDKLVRHDVGQVPVMERDKLVGIIDRRDILLWLQLKTGKG